MKYTIIIERPAQKQLAKIRNPFREAISRKILLLEDNPRPPGCKMLEGREGWQIRIGDYRVIYKIDDSVLKLLVIEIDNRKQIYR